MNNCKITFHPHFATTVNSFSFSCHINSLLLLHFGPQNTYLIQSLYYAGPWQIKCMYTIHNAVVCYMPSYRSFSLHFLVQHTSMNVSLIDLTGLAAVGWVRVDQYCCHSSFVQLLTWHDSDSFLAHLLLRRHTHQRQWMLSIPIERYTDWLTVRLLLQTLLINPLQKFPNWLVWFCSVLTFNASWIYSRSMLSLVHVSRILGNFKSTYNCNLLYIRMNI